MNYHSYLPALHYDLEGQIMMALGGTQEKEKLTKIKKALKGRNKEEEKMPQSLAQILIHIAFSTKNREPFILPDIEKG